MVVLIDEYDKPLLRSLFKDDLHNIYREMLTGFYTVLKDADRYLRFVFISEFQTDGIFNPFSVLNALTQKRFSSYWFATGTPTMLVDMLKKTDYDLRQLDGIEVPAAALT